ncbi:MAG: hypothetical protein DRH90_06685 [Deltaproteobacteria bacterium]|nr:MAG: hypothetical protein DRH90_06685 [Deltaproteobacteria bacterium]RLC12416.1 MAG: hypothetical protein DRI24_17400 [Deltaproteobacteria bacterium]
MYFGAKNKAITKTRNLKNTKFFMFFFVISYLRGFVIKNLFLFWFIRIGFCVRTTVLAQELLLQPVLLLQT